jgi:uncharacterized protein (TIGR02391 family)
MASTATTTLEGLCDKEFELVRDEAYLNLDREAADIREHFGIRGLARSSGLGRRILDAVLARYDQVLASFEKIYIGKWSETDREFTESDHEWLRNKAMSVLQAEAQEAQTICQNLLYEPSLYFQGWWQRTGPEAREKNKKIMNRIEILKLQKGQARESKPASPTRPANSAPAPEFWSMLHPKVVEVAKSRFDTGHYADAAEAAFKEINDIVRKLVKTKTGAEYDGASLMQFAFSPQHPVLKLDDLGGETGRNIQLGYMQIFSGAITGIRNPKAHANVKIDSTRCIHFLFLASLLLCKLDERI